MTILDRDTLARILALPGFDAAACAPDAQGTRHGLAELELADEFEHDGWQAIRWRPDTSPKKEWWNQ